MRSEIETCLKPAISVSNMPQNKCTAHSRISANIDDAQGTEMLDLLEGTVLLFIYLSLKQKLAFIVWLLLYSCFYQLYC